MKSPRGDNPTRWFSEADQVAISRATRRAEAGHAGEIVPYVVRHCAEGPESSWALAAVGALAGAALAALLAGGGDHGWPLRLWILMPPFLGACLALLLLWLWPALEHRLLPASLIDQRVLMRAKLAFLDEAVFSTRDRSGMLLFVALRERRALVLADEGISSRVAPEEWQDIIDRLIAAIRAGSPTAGMVEAIEAFGRLLERRGPPARADDTDELSDAVRIHPD